MTTEPELPVPVPATEPEPFEDLGGLPVPFIEILNIEDPAIGLMTQFVIAVMLHQGLTEIRLPKALLGQAMTKPVIALDEEEFISFRIHRE